MLLNSRIFGHMVNFMVLEIALEVSKCLTEWGFGYFFSFRQP